ncbi:MAG: HAD-IIIC family phosphatase [Chthoniobacterales bacterium]
MSDEVVKSLLLSGSPDFWNHLALRTSQVADFNDLFRLSALRRKAIARQIPRPNASPMPLRLAILGGYSLYPFHDLLEHLLQVEGFVPQLWLGDFDNYTSEIMDEASGIHAFQPQVVLLLPSEQRCKYPGNLTDSRETQQAEAGRLVDSLLQLARKIYDGAGAEVIMTNFKLPARHDLGGYRSRTLGSDWSYRKWVNLELGLKAPPFLHICDFEFLAHRFGGIRASDERAWFESKQLCAPDLLADLAREVAQVIRSLRRGARKVLVLDLDNTLWGGVVTEDGLEGIEIGDTSPRGEAFKAFQKYILSLKERGVLLAIASKNDHARAVEVFQKHPEMVLRLNDFVSTQINWDPKSDNLHRIASELNLGLDSFVFVDDNPAEIEIVRQFAPAVALIELGPDPAEYVPQLQDCRLFEPRSLTAEDMQRTDLYHAEVQRLSLSAAITDMDTYLESLAMEGEICEFTPVDIPRLAQLINKSNQFNLTTRRRSEADLHALLHDPDYFGFSLRLKDRFGGHGLISIVIAQKTGAVVNIDTWLMSCRVLKRQVEEEVLNELVRLAKSRGGDRLEGVYLPTAKNGMVRDFYSSIGFTLTEQNEAYRKFQLQIQQFQPRTTKITITRRVYESIRDHTEAPAHL